jgi:RNA polymerase sigma factor (sigma-70 family)
LQESPEQRRVISKRLEKAAVLNTMQSMTPMVTDPIPTRYSLLSRLQNWDDGGSWKEFFDTYWQLIYSTAIKSGLTQSEAQDVVQETIICVAKDINKFKRDRGRGSFKGWLKNLTRWRIADQLRKRIRANGGAMVESASELTSAEIADPAAGLEAAWEEEWQANLLAAAMQRVKGRVKEEHYQMFDLYAVRGWPVNKVAELLGVSVARIYLVKHRVAGLIRKEVRLLEEKEY